LKKRIAVLGSTGTLGRNALQIIEKNPSEFEVAALTANSNTELIIEQAHKFRPKIVAFTGRRFDIGIEKRLPPETKVVYGNESLKAACGESGANFAFIAVVGIAGLPALMECIDKNLPVALANKEALVCGGPIVKSKLNEKKMNILPVDSELSAIFQCLNGQYDTTDVRRLILTASGGPFRQSTPEKIYYARVKDALCHPNWRMGKKITVDCATMMNKGLEVIEARWLFDIPPEKIDIIVHPQSIIHSMVEYKNGAILAQMSPTNMKQPIQYAFSWPKRLPSAVDYLDLAKVRSLTFEAPDFKRFPSMRLAYECLAAGNGACVVLNSANEAAVEMFLDEKFHMGRIYELVCDALDKFSGEKCDTIEEVYELDKNTRRFVHELHKKESMIYYSAQYNE
jgi:1-deoxy-D-xylulose-5-phosphate reductoisomerase